MKAPCAKCGTPISFGFGASDFNLFLCKPCFDAYRELRTPPKKPAKPTEKDKK